MGLLREELDRGESAGVGGLLSGSVEDGGSVGGAGSVVGDVLPGAGGGEVAEEEVGVLHAVAGVGGGADGSGEFGVPVDEGEVGASVETSFGAFVSP